MPLNILRTSIPALVVALFITACGGGSGGGTTTPTTTSLSGTAAVGFAVANATVNIKCASSTSIASSTTNASGAIQMSLSGQTLPCAIQVSGGTINGSANTTNYHSIATSAGNVNATPLTDLLIANLAGTATPSAWFNSLTTTQLAAITSGQVTTATTNVKTALGLTTQLAGIDPITTVFTPTNDNVMDNTLEALQTAITNNGTSYASLLTGAGTSANAGFTTPGGFNAALTSAYVPPTGGGGGTTPTITGFSPTSGTVGSTVAITGTNLVLGFPPAPTVKFGTINAGGPYTNVSNTGVTFTVPAGLAAGSYAITIGGSGTPLTVGTFTVMAGGTVPNAPTGVTASAISATQINLSWPAVTGATSFNVYRSTSTGFTIGAATKITTSPVTTRTFNDTGVTGLTQYYYKVTAINASGESVESAEVMSRSRSLGLSITPSFKSALSFADSVRITSITPAIGYAQFQYRQTSLDPVVAANGSEDFIDFAHLVSGAQATLSVVINVGTPMVNVPNATSFSLMQISCDLAATSGKPTCASLGVAFDQAVGTLTFTNTPFVYAAQATTHTVNGTLSFTPF